MILIIEGADGSGKTTLANYLSKKLGYPIRHRSKPNSQAEKDAMMQEYLDDIKDGHDGERGVIWDRAFYSEMVYGPIMRDKTYISTEQMIVLEELMVPVGAMIFYCTAPYQVLWDRCTKRGETYVTNIETLAALSDRFHYVMLKQPHKIPVVRYEVPYGDSMPTL